MKGFLVAFMALVFFSQSVFANEYMMRQGVSGMHSDEGDEVKISSFLGVDVNELSDGVWDAPFITGSSSSQIVYLEKEYSISSIEFSGMGRLWQYLYFHDGNTGQLLGVGACPGGYSCQEKITFPEIKTDKIEIRTSNWVFLGEIVFK